MEYNQGIQVKNEQAIKEAPSSPRRKAMKERKGSNTIFVTIAILSTISILLNFLYLELISSSATNGYESNSLNHGIPEIEDDLHNRKQPSSDNDEALSSAKGSLLEADDHRKESFVFQKILERAVNNVESCNGLPQVREKHQVNESMILLPEFGIVNAITKWQTDPVNSSHYPYQCLLPPDQSCDEPGYSVVLLAYKKTKWFKLAKGLRIIEQRPLAKEIILVWNSAPEDLQNPEVLKKANDTSHPLRIFYHNLGNSLFNRWHPDINPKYNAVLYFDDDGPFFSHVAIETGFELWKRNSGVPVSLFPRSYRFQTIHDKKFGQFTNERMSNAMRDEMEHTMTQTQQQWQFLSPYDHSTFRTSIQAKYPNAKHPSFIPFCPDAGDFLEYNFNVFPPFGAHMSLPSGTFIHKNFLCFIWHPVFAELKDFVLIHPTYPDDVTVSAIMSQVAGKPLKTFPEKIQNNPVEEKQEEKQKRRKLLWLQANWADMRTEAINSIIGYFGSVQPGSAGWCVNTTSYRFNPRPPRNFPLRQQCTVEKPFQKDIPWMHQDGFGYDQC